MGATLTGLVLAPWSPGYDDARVDYNGRFPPFRPRYIVYCEVPQDVQQAVRWARRHRLPFRIRSGGHSYEAYSLLNDGLVIDVSRLRQMTFDPHQRIAQIGAGSRLLEIYETLWNAGRFTIPGGSCPTVGIAGLTLGGGYGLISRRWGLTVDALTAVELVDARGDLVQVSSDRYPDLFWALRGAGGNNFGVVTRFWFRTVDVDHVTIFSLRWPWLQLPNVLKTYQQWGDPLGLDFRLTPILTLPSRDLGYVAVVGQFLGPPDELLPLLAPLLAVGDLERQNIQYVSYIDAVKHFAGITGDPAHWLAQGLPQQDTFKNTSAYQMHLFPDRAIEVIQATLSETPSPSCLVQLDLYGGAVGAVPPTATAFFHRRARSALQYQAYWTNPAQQDSHIAWVESFRRRMRPFTEGAYVNYCDGRIRNWPAAYYGANLSRLLAVKRRWDPHNLFRFPQGLSELIHPSCRSLAFWNN
ncbi:MAG: FAD-binding oxidoreductase [Sulfobacillus sp.]|nr:FAD-binding oxidoreductase [Sulfobacillus sp.]